MSSSNSRYQRGKRALIGSTFVHLPRSPPPPYTTPLLAYDSTRLRNLLTIWSEWIGSPAIKNIIAILGIGRETG